MSANESALARARRLAAEGKDKSDSSEGSSSSDSSEKKKKKKQKKREKKTSKKLKKAEKKAKKEEKKRKHEVDSKEQEEDDKAMKKAMKLAAAEAAKEEKRAVVGKRDPAKPAVPTERSLGETEVVDAFAYDPTKKRAVATHEPVSQEELRARGISPWHMAK
eukprot:TRINITY_DN114302_c0_g1_i1.p1 TRINITY_DN114302_c0_g1~~TRINITY_DN114302_c0_g1_i1.p1  ORF type:complete len:170 (-),score=48.34 TRINITY_DN114302_c0_g1_i1:62-547(-)